CHDEECEEDACEAVEDECEHDCESIAGLHEPEERCVFADHEGYERPERDTYAAESGKDEDEVADIPAESSDGDDQHGPDDAGADEAEEEERTDRRYDIEVVVVVLLGVHDPDDHQRDGAQVARSLADQEAAVDPLSPARACGLAAADASAVRRRAVHASH